MLPSGTILESFVLKVSIVADLSYRFVATSEPDFDGREEYNSHNLVAAIRFSFR